MRLMRRLVAEADGIEPRRLPPLARPVVLPRWFQIIGTNRPLFRLIRPEAGVNLTHACRSRQMPPMAFGKGRALSEMASDSPGVPLVYFGRDSWFQDRVGWFDPASFQALALFEPGAVIGPNLSAFAGAEHRVWLINRAMCQTVAGRMIEAGLPAVIHLFFEDLSYDVDWAAEYLRMNPTQHHLATGFDYDGDKSAANVNLTLEALQKIERAVGRPLHVILNGVLTRFELIERVERLFPKRCTFCGSSVATGTSLSGRAALREESESLWAPEPSLDLPRNLVTRDNHAKLRERMTQCLGL